MHFLQVRIYFVCLNICRFKMLPSDYHHIHNLVRHKNFYCKVPIVICHEIPDKEDRLVQQRATYLSMSLNVWVVCLGETIPDFRKSRTRQLTIEHWADLLENNGSEPKPSLGYLVMRLISARCNNYYLIFGHLLCHM